MNAIGVYMGIAFLIPLASSLLLFVYDVGISERHHSHHDTYVIGSNLMITLVLAMILMGGIGILLGWLCLIGVFWMDCSFVMSFFDAFLVVTFAFWLVIRRYKVTTYDDRLEITPFFGPRTAVAYDDISAMEWTPSILMPSRRNVVIYVGQKPVALLWSGLDLEQILVRINRFDVLDSLSSAR